MTDQEILQAAIKKAQQNGWSGYDAQYVSSSPDEKGMPVSGFIFSHDFCRAFFGEENVTAEIGVYRGIDGKKINSIKYPRKGWKHHLQKMVLEPEPLTYLSKFLED